MTNPPAQYLQLPYSGATFKTSHNSYDRNEKPVTTHYRQLGTDLWQGRCRGIELDINGSSENWAWSVAHGGGYEGRADTQFSAYLCELARWHGHLPDHDVLTVMIDLKDSTPLDATAQKRSFGFAEALDDLIRDALPRVPIYRPSDLQGNAPTLRAGASKGQGGAKSSWPTIAQLRGSFIFCLTGSEDLKKTYVTSSIDNLCFADQSFEPGDIYPVSLSDDRVFYNFDIDSWWLLNHRHDDWMRAVKAFATDGYCVTRGYVINDSTTWTNGITAGLSMLATDKVKDTDWASVGPDPFVARSTQPIPPMIA